MTTTETTTAQAAAELEHRLLRDLAGRIGTDMTSAEVLLTVTTLHCTMPTLARAVDRVGPEAVARLLRTAHTLRRVHDAMPAQSDGARIAQATELGALALLLGTFAADD